MKKLVSMALAALLVAGPGGHNDAAVAGSDTENSGIADQLRRMETTMEQLMREPVSGEILFSDSSLPAGWSLETINDGRYENGELRAKPTNGTVRLTYEGEIGDFDLSFDCGFGVAYWGTQCEVTFFLSDGSEVTFFHGNKEYEYGKANVVWAGDKATRKTFPLARSDASYFFRRTMDIYSNEDRFMIGVWDRATGEQITQMSALAPKYGYRVSRITVTVHNTTGDAKAWLDNLGYWFAPG